VIFDPAENIRLKDGEYLYVKATMHLRSSIFDFRFIVSARVRGCCIFLRITQHHLYFFCTPN
jgi:hypothetical protein